MEVEFKHISSQEKFSTANVKFQALAMLGVKTTPCTSQGMVQND